jgi:hypothetical protein
MVRLVFFIGAVPLVENEKPWEIPWLPVVVPEGAAFLDHLSYLMRSGRIKRFLGKFTK